MSNSIEELDAMVRAFYEGRGEQVGCAWIGHVTAIKLLTFLVPYSKKLLKQVSTRLAPDHFHFCCF